VINEYKPGGNRGHYVVAVMWVGLANEINGKKLKIK
jgi:hypothetical protein